MTDNQRTGRLQWKLVWILRHSKTLKVDAGKTRSLFHWMFSASWGFVLRFLCSNNTNLSFPYLVGSLQSTLYKLMGSGTYGRIGYSWLKHYVTLMTLTAWQFQKREGVPPRSVSSWDPCPGSPPHTGRWCPTWGSRNTGWGRAYTLTPLTWRLQICTERLQTARTCCVRRAETDHSAMSSQNDSLLSYYGEWTRWIDIYP